MFRATRTVWTGPRYYEAVDLNTAQEDRASNLKIITNRNGTMYVEEKYGRIQVWTIPFRVLATPFSVLVDLIAPFIGQEP